MNLDNVLTTIAAILLIIAFFGGMLQVKEYQESEEYLEQKRIEQEKIDNCNHEFLMITEYDPITKYRLVHKCSKCGYSVR